MNNRPLIRVIGDAVLHSKGHLFPKPPTTVLEVQALLQQIAIAEKVLIATGGAGIAANQCSAIERPYQFIIVGIFHDNETHVANVEKRYPGKKFPEATVMINPRVIYSSVDTTSFSHGCLSVPGTARGEISTPREIHVEFETLNEKCSLITQTKKVSDIDAVVLQHELNHILHGKTYIDCCFEALPAAELHKLKTAFLKEEERRQAATYKPVDLSKPLDFCHVVHIKPDGSSVVDDAALRKALDTCIDNPTLQGLINRLELRLKKKIDLTLLAEVRIGAPVRNVSDMKSELRAKL